MGQAGWGAEGCTHCGRLHLNCSACCPPLTRPSSHPPLPSAGKPCITDTAEECQKCLNARLSMVDKRLKPGVWGDPPSYRDRLNPVPMQPAAEQQQQQQQQAAAGSSARGAATWAPVSSAAASDRGSSNGGQRRGLHTVPAAAQQAAPAAAAKAGALFGGGPAKGSDVPRTNIGIFGCMNAGKSSLMNRITRR